MSKFVIISLFAVLAVVNARGLNGDIANIENNEIAPVKKEERLLLEVPTIATIVFKSLKVVWFLVTKICSVIDLKLAALALAVKAGVWALSFKFPVLVGAALTLGFCKLTGLCTFKSTLLGLEKADQLAYAEEYLDLGTLKYGGSN